VGSQSGEECGFGPSLPFILGFGAETFCGSERLATSAFARVGAVLGVQAHDSICHRPSWRQAADHDERRDVGSDGLEICNDRRVGLTAGADAAGTKEFLCMPTK
jgi:hypothetical protein